MPEYAGIGEVLDVGETLQLFRERDDKTQGEVASETGVSHTTISNIETGRNPRPHLGTVRRLARAFEVSAEEFLTRKDLTVPLARGPQTERWSHLRALDRNAKLKVLEAAKAMKFFGEADIDTAESAVVVGKLTDALVELQQIAPELSEQVGIMEHLVHESDLDELRAFLLDEEGKPDTAVVLAFTDVLRHHRNRGTISPELEESRMSTLKRAVG